MCIGPVSAATNQVRMCRDRPLIHAEGELVETAGESRGGYAICLENVRVTIHFALSDGKGGLDEINGQVRTVRVGQCFPSAQ